MDSDTIDHILQFLESGRVSTLDITGGAPEIHPEFRRLVSGAVDRDIHVIDRCNLTILLEPGYESLAEFLASHRVEIIASLPCYQKDNVDRQRGEGVFEKSVAALQLLNQSGYGQTGTGLVLNLVYNPQGPVLSPPQDELETAYRDSLGRESGISFNSLFTLCNMPIKRFGSTLVSRGEFDDYMTLLKTAHRDENLDGVMCRSLISVDWQGYLYDCDFNQMLGLPFHFRNRERTHISELIDLDIENNPVVVREHCYGCTAGQGSSCGGALK